MLEEIDIHTCTDQNDENEKTKMIDEIVEIILQFIDDIIKNDPTLLSCHDVDEIIMDELYDMMEQVLDDLKEENFVLYSDYYKLIDEMDLIEYSFDIYNDTFNIKHDNQDNEIKGIELDLDIDLDFGSNNDNKIEKLEAQIDYLRSKPQPEQRTNEWYKFRHTLLTASNAHKAFGTQSAINSLICEKCQPLKQIDPDEPEVVKSVNLNSPMHWGQKYEPLSVLIYEEKYNTKVEDFGCIQHDKYSFVGASPDGINVLSLIHI